jgi:solute carrier family 25 (mitochondrial carnitine/acylcarnitine transporter), member 20/29
LQTQPASGPREYAGAIDCVKKILANEGLFAFYKGTATPLVGIGACVSIQFGTFEFMKRFFRTRNEDAGHIDTTLSGGQFYVAGCAAGVANTIVACMSRVWKSSNVIRSC